MLNQNKSKKGEKKNHKTNRTDRKQILNIKYLDLNLNTCIHICLIRVNENSVNVLIKRQKFWGDREQMI